MSISSRSCLCALLLYLSTGCQDGAATANEAIEVAKADLADQLRGRTLDDAIDMGDRWRLSYVAPEGSTGGPLIVVVNKRSGKIVHMETEQ